MPTPLIGCKILLRFLSRRFLTPLRRCARKTNLPTLSGLKILFFHITNSSGNSSGNIPQSSSLFL
jgi:hypothetical protein